MQIHYKTYTLGLEELPLDIGYASEKVKMFDSDNKSETVGGQNGKTQLFLSVPFIDEKIEQELKEISTMIFGGEMLSADELDALECTLVVANDTHRNPNIDGMKFLIDKEGEFGDWYGVRLEGEALAGEFTKSLMMISKDGALFYDEYPTDIETPFNHETLIRKITAAHTCYTGKGCH